MTIKPPAGKQPCARCGAPILEQTANRTGGLCMPCKEGRREQMDEAARRNAADRERRAREEKARAPLAARLAAGETVRFIDFFHLNEPAYEIFRAASKTAYSGGRGEELGRLSPECRLMYVLWRFGGDLDNAGLGYWITDASPALLAEVLAGLEAVGARGAQVLLLRALRWFPEALFTENGQLRRRRFAVLCERDDFERDLKGLDEEMAAGAEEYFGLIGEYVRANPDAVIARHAR